jgi:SAM-dependent methyltransferase
MRLTGSCHTRRVDRSSWINAVPLTSRYSDWNTQSEYHALREGDAKVQVVTQLYPYIDDFCATYNQDSYSVADFACGHGSVSKEVLLCFLNRGKRVDRFGLLDVAADNLPVATENLRQLAQSQGQEPPLQVEPFRLNGSNLSDYNGAKYDLVYSWDAMVHFDLLDVVGYISSMSQLCKKRAIFHHSGYGQPTTDISNNPHWRNFMTAETFAQICLSSGLKIVSQQRMDWGLKDLDCITCVDFPG